MGKSHTNLEILFSSALNFNLVCFYELQLLFRGTDLFSGIALFCREHLAVSLSQTNKYRIPE